LEEPLAFREGFGVRSHKDRGGTRRFIAMDKGAQAAIAAKLIDEEEQVEAKICLGFYLCEDCGEIHFIEAPTELQ
jgi:hypothetical protein